MYVLMGSDDAGSTSLDNLVLEYDFNEGEGQTVEDKSGNGWTGYLGGSVNEEGTDPVWSPGVNGTAMEFDGVDDYVICNPFDMPQSEFTIALWVNTAETSYDGFFLSYAVEGEDNEILIGTDPNLHIEIDHPNILYTDIEVRDGYWHHVAITWRSSDGDIRVYIDGVEEASDTLSEGVEVLQGGSLVLGNEQDDVGGGFESNQGLVGFMDDLMITSTYSSSSEVSDLYGEYHAPIRGIEVLEGNEFVDISWEQCEDPELDHYNVYRLGPEHMQNGLSGDYYDNKNLTDLKTTRVDETIDFRWESSSPDPSIEGDTYSVRWTGFIRIDAPGYYTFHTESDDGIRLWIAGRLVIDYWRDGISTREGSIKLDNGIYPIRLDYYENLLTAKMILKWSSSRISESVIPGENLITIDGSAFEKIATVKDPNLRDSGLTNDENYFYFVTYQDVEGKESGRSNLVGAIPSFQTSLVIKPIKRTATVGSDISYEIKVTNQGGSFDWFNIEISDLNESWYDLSKNRFGLTPGEYEVVLLYISIPVDADEGTLAFSVQLETEINVMFKQIGGWMVLITDPVITDLFPKSGSRIGTTNVLFTWMTPVDSTTEVYLKKEDDGDFQKYVGDPGKQHNLNISDFERETNYVYYVRSETSRGSVQSDERTFTVDSGVSFTDRIFVQSIDRNYDQKKQIGIVNNDDEVHYVLAEVNSDYKDLIVGFTGRGSEDGILAIPPGEKRYLDISYHAQDAMRKEYWLTLNLTTVPQNGEEPLTDTSIVRVKLNHLFVNMTVEEIGSNPYTLEKTIRITNLDDPVTDLKVYPEDRIKQVIKFDPMVNHEKMESKEVKEVKISPVLTYAFPGFSGRIFVSAYDKIYNITLDFQPTPGWEVFAASVFPNWGGIPFREIDPDDIDMDGIPNGEDDDMDGDGIPNVEEQFHSMDTDNDGFPNAIDNDDDGDGNPDASDFWRIDFDNDWLPNYLDDDRDGDGINNTEDEHPDDLDNDGIINGMDPDDDNDLIPDDKDYHPGDHDNDGERDSDDEDDDDDETPDYLDDYPYDQDNDGISDRDDSDWKGGGIPDWKDDKWNPNPRPGGSPGGWGGGGGSGSSGGEDWYCTNKPEIDPIDLIVEVWNMVSTLLTAGGIVLSLCTPGGLAAAIGSAVLYAATQMAYYYSGTSQTEATKYLAHSYDDWVNSRSSSRGIMGRIIRENVAKYYPDYSENISRMPRMLWDDTGYHFYWHENKGEDTQIFYARSSEFSPKLDVYTQLTETTGNSVWPSMDGGPDGEVAMTWVDYRDGDGEVYFKYSEDGGDTWGDDIRVTNAVGDVDDPVVKIDEYGRVHIAWADERDGNSEIYHRYTNDGGGTWEEEHRITNTSAKSTHPYMEYGGDMNLHMVYREGESGHGEINYTKSDNRGYSWSTPTRISDSGADAGEPSLTVTGNGTVHVVWRDSKHGTSEVYYRRGEDQAALWDDEVRITDDESYSEYPHVTSLNNTVMISWHDDRTGLDLDYFQFSQDDGITWSKEKRSAAGYEVIDHAYLEMEFKPQGPEEMVKPHTVHVLVNDIEIGTIEDAVPNGKYIFDIPLNVLNLADSMFTNNSIRVVTEHMNSGHYVVLTNWKVTYHYLNRYEFICAPDQYTADEYLRGNIVDNWTIEDPAIYANNLELSDMKPTVGDRVRVTAEIYNPGGSLAEDVDVSFYAGDPENSSRQIGEKVTVKAIPPFGSYSVTANWTAEANITRIYCVVDEDDNIQEGDETNNLASAPVTPVFTIPPRSEFVIDGGQTQLKDSMIILTFFDEGPNEITHVRFSNDNETWSQWKVKFEYMGWDLDEGSITRAYSPGDGLRTLYVQFRDIAGLESEVYSETVEVFKNGPVIISSNVDDGILMENQSIWFEFSNPMDDLSVRENLDIDPQIDGSFSWEGRMLRFNPQIKWIVNETYNFTFNSDTEDIWNRDIGSAIFYEFTIIENGSGGGNGGGDEKDTDGDGIPDWWEDKYGLNKTDPTDAEGDLDNDGISNLDEFIKGTDPTDPKDVPSDDDDDDDGDGLGPGVFLFICLAALILLILVVIMIVVLARRSRGEEDQWEE